MWLKISEIAKREGISVMTARRYARAGRFGKIHETPGGHIRVWVDKGEPEVVLYCRVNSPKEKGSLEEQAKVLSQLRPEGKVVNDIGSGYDLNRRGFRTILERSLRGIPQVIVATSRDKIVKKGFPLIKQLIELSGGSVVLYEENETKDEFSTEELISFIESYIENS